MLDADPSSGNRLPTATLEPLRIEDITMLKPIAEASARRDAPARAAQQGPQIAHVYADRPRDPQPSANFTFQIT